MKKIILMAFVTIVAVMGGGNAVSTLPKVVKISANTCHKDKTFVDKNTNLMWQDQHFTDVEDAAFKNNRSVAKAGNHKHAVKYCRTLNYAGYSDWRLPTKDELMAVHRLEGQVFTNFRDGDFWTSTQAMGSKYYVVYPADAYPYERNQKESNYIRCVRCVSSTAK